MQVAQQVRRHFPHEVRAWEGSLQQAGRLQQLATSADQWVAVLAALLAPLILIFAYRQRDRSLFGLSCIVLATILGNAAICGALSGPADRYQSRVLWLLPLIGMLALAQWLGKQKRMPAR
jgi:hypothetical protein